MTRLHQLLLLITSCSVILAWSMWANWKIFSITYSIKEYEYMYSQSQYVLGDSKTHVMGDGDIYTYAGIRYLALTDPTTINFEHPPFIKYLFGLSYQVLGNPNFIHIVFFWLAVSAFWQITSYAFNSFAPRLIAVIALFMHPLVQNLMTATMLDFPTMSLSLATIAAYLALMTSFSTRKLVSFVTLAGLFLSAKYPLPLNALLVMFLITSLHHKHKRFSTTLIVAISTACVYLSTYILFFTHGHSFIDWIRFEWWRWNWYQGKVSGSWFLILPIIFTGKQLLFWEIPPSFLTIASWTIYWPINFVLSLVGLFFKSTWTHILTPYFIWSLISFIILLIGGDGDRFILPLLPVWTLLMVKTLQKIVNHSRSIKPLPIFRYRIMR